MFECDQNCGTCAHWLADYFKPILAERPTGRVRVGQCGCTDDDAAPFAEQTGGPAFVFTAEGALCGAWKLHPEAAADFAADYAAEARLYAGLERDRAREAGERL